MVNTRTLCLVLCVALVGVVLIPQEVSARRKKYLIAYLVAKALKPRFVPIPLPLPLPIKFKKESHAKHPVHIHEPPIVHAHHVGGHHGW